MPDLDLALILCTFGGAVYPLLGRTLSRPLRAFFLVIAAAVLGGQLYLVGPHWQIFPAYLAFSLMSYVVWHHQLGRRYRVMAIVADTLCIFTLGLLWILPVFSLPQPTGDHLVGTTGPISWVDTSRSLSGDATQTGPRRELIVQIWYPAAERPRSGEEARYTRRKEVSLAHSYFAAVRTNSILNAPIDTTGSPFPVLLFGHRWNGSRTQNTVIAEDLASHGYVVVAVDHPLNATRVQLSDGSVVRSNRSDALDNLEAKSAPSVMAAWGRELEIWEADNEFVLNKLQSNDDGQFANHLDMTRVGAFGHSFGGAASTNMLGQDPRVKAAVNLDGWTFQGLDHRTNQPILVVYEGGASNPQPQPGVEGTLNATDTNGVEASLKAHGGLRAFVAGALHLDFTDQTLFSPLRRLTFTGPIQGERVREITRGLVLGFFDQTLKGKGEIPTYPEVKIEHWPENRQPGSF